MTFKLLNGFKVEYELHNTFQDHIFTMCHLYNVKIEKTKREYLDKNPHIDPNSDYSYPINFTTQWHVNGYKLWHAEKNINEDNINYTHNLYIEIDHYDHYIYIDVLETPDGNFSIYEVGMEEDTQKIIHNYQELFKPNSLYL